MPGRHDKSHVKRRSHGKGASKGLRWAKGQSCVSNPGTRKFRDQASSNFLHPVSGNFALKSLFFINAFECSKGTGIGELILIFSK